MSKSIESDFSLFIHGLCQYLLSLCQELMLFIDARLQDLPLFQPLSNRIAFWDSEFCQIKGNEISMIISLGGDGTVLNTSWLFQNCPVPPVMPFYLGSLGFLTGI